MTDKPILFSGAMVRAILDGRKSVTRRALKPQPFFRGGVGTEHDPEAWGWEDDMGDHVPVTAARLRWRPGDRLWVRENGWQPSIPDETDIRCGADTWPRYVYDPDGITEDDAASYRQWGWKRRPSIHMPRWASRITLEVTAVRVERLQSITSADAICEGCPPYANSQTIDSDTPDPRDDFKAIWNTINGPGAWHANPWVAVVSFKRAEIANG